MEEERLLYPITTADGYEEDITTVATLKRDAPPAHYTFKIESFSQLSDFLNITRSEKYESHDFEVGGYKWKLSLYPNGDKKRNGSGHISLYLVMSETNDLPLGSEVTASFTLFVYDQIRDKYLTVQDVRNKHTRFYAMKVEHGFSRFLPLVTFNDASSGYLVDDCCIFGVEIFIRKWSGRGECVSIKKPEKTITYKLENFSKLEKRIYNSGPVEIEGYNWSIEVHPHGQSDADVGYLSMFLSLDRDLCPPKNEKKIWACFTLTVKNQKGRLHFETQVEHWFDDWGYSWGMPRFLRLSDLKEKSYGYTVKDTVIIEVQVNQILTAKDFS